MSQQAWPGPPARLCLNPCLATQSLATAVSLESDRYCFKSRLCYWTFLNFNSLICEVMSVRLPVS